VNCDAVQTGLWVPTFRQDLLPLSSGHSSKSPVFCIDFLLGPRTILDFHDNLGEKLLLIWEDEGAAALIVGEKVGTG
jgi:hypothetical protein